MKCLDLKESAKLNRTSSSLVNTNCPCRKLTAYFLYGKDVRAYVRACVCVCVCVRARACVRACVRAHVRAYVHVQGAVKSSAE